MLVHAGPSFFDYFGTPIVRIILTKQVGNAGLVELLIFLKRNCKSNINLFEIFLFIVLRIVRHIPIRTREVSCFTSSIAIISSASVLEVTTAWRTKSNKTTGAARDYSEGTFQHKSHFECRRMTL
jgi:hypothetical protein